MCGRAVTRFEQIGGAVSDMTRRMRALSGAALRPADSGERARF